MPFHTIVMNREQLQSRESRVQFCDVQRESLKQFFLCASDRYELSAAHCVVLESLNELIKNASDANARHMIFNVRQVAGKCIVSVLDNGSGFSSHFLNNKPLIDYATKLNGANGILSDKLSAEAANNTDDNDATAAAHMESFQQRGRRNSFGGAGLGLAQATEVLTKNKGALRLSNRCDSDGNVLGARIEFIASNKPVEEKAMSAAFEAVRSSAGKRTFGESDSDAFAELDPNAMAAAFKLALPQLSSATTSSASTRNGGLFSLASTTSASSNREAIPTLVLPSATAP